MLSGTGYSELPPKEKAFYALSSLRFYFDKIYRPEHVEQSNNDFSSLFNDNDISKLWSKAEGAESNMVLLAKGLYIQVLSLKGDAAVKALSTCRKHLKTAWEELHPNFITGENGTQLNIPDLNNFLLQTDSSLFKALSTIFSSPKALNSEVTLANAGFDVISKRPSGMFVAKHARLKNMLIKTFVHSKRTQDNWLWCFKRCWGVDCIAKLIDSKQLRHYTVPVKKIYPFFPKADSFDIDTTYTPAILVVTDMKIGSHQESMLAWKTVPTKRHIQELYCLLTHGYSSCLLPFNIPYTKDGKFACIDTEHPQRTMHFEHVPRHLSEEMGKYWRYLIRTGGSGMPF